MDYKMQIDLCLYGNSIPPKEITDMLGVEPDTALLKGERNKERDLPRQNLWSLRSDPNGDSVEKQWYSIVQRLGNKWDQFVDVSKRGDVKITIIVNVDEYIPSIMIPPNMAFAAATLNAYIDIDHYK